MTRWFALSCVLIALAGGCAPSNAGLVVDGLLFPPDSCSYDPSSEALILRPVLDTTSFGTPTYVGVVRVTNRLIALANSRYPLRAEPNVMSIDYAEIEILQTDGTRYPFSAGLPNPFRVVAAGTIPPSTGLEGVPGITAVEMIPAVYGAELAGVTGTIVLSIRVTATTAGGATITSGEWSFPLDLCANCLLACDCGATMLESTCFPGQDEVVRLPATDPTCVPVCPAP